MHKTSRNIFYYNAVYPQMYSDGSETSHPPRVLVILMTGPRDRSKGETIYLLKQSCSCLRCASV